MKRERERHTEKRERQRDTAEKDMQTDRQRQRENITIINNDETIKY